MPNLFTDRVIMTALATILAGYPTPNTNLSQVRGSIVIENEYKLSNSKFPAIHIEVGPQRHSIVGNNAYDAVMKIMVTYYDRYDEQQTPIDGLRLNIDTDLQTMMTNVQRNPSLIIGQQSNATSISYFDLSDYKGELDKQTVPGLTLVKRMLTLTVNVLPYDV
ncbi:MAG: hypothetical protein NVS4B1_33450 [Ktedonobacteraceae bacterium]